MADAPTPRRRDAAASRRRLLEAAGQLFADRGFQRTTARDIGERAGVDPTMIARYFGGKTQLYIAVLHEEIPGTPTDFLDSARLASIVKRADRHGPGPTFRAIFRPIDDPVAQAAASEDLHRRIVAPVSERLAQDGNPEPQLRAEMLTAALLGILLARQAGTLETLAAASADQILPLLGDVLGAKEPTRLPCDSDG
jgi:AcrR family transcriptional regulator